MRVAVAYDLQVEMVGSAPAGEHRVQLLPGLLSGGEAVHGVGGDTLGGVDGGGVAETGRLADIVGGEPDGEVAAVMSDREVAVPADWVMVQRSPFLTQSVAVRRSRRSLLRVMITSPTLAWFPSANRTSRPAGAPSSLCVRARRLRSATSWRVGASMIASSPAARSAAQAVNASRVVVARSPT